MLSLSDALNCWLQETWPTLYAHKEPVPTPTGAVTVIARKGSNHWVLTFYDNGKVHTNAGVFPKHNLSVGSPSDPKFLDRLNNCLLRFCNGKDLR
jgi:hypothetical protein